MGSCEDLRLGRDRESGTIMVTPSHLKTAERSIRPRGRGGSLLVIVSHRQRAPANPHELRRDEENGYINARARIGFCLCTTHTVQHVLEVRVTVRYNFAFRADIQSACSLIERQRVREASSTLRKMIRSGIYGNGHVCVFPSSDEQWRTPEQSIPLLLLPRTYH